MLSLLALVLFWFSLLEIGDMSPHSGWLYIALALNATYSTALFFLLMFYLGTRELLAVGLASFDCKPPSISLNDSVALRCKRSTDPGSSSF